jgi:phage-related protein (TIGR01555 family)
MPIFDASGRPVSTVGGPTPDPLDGYTPPVATLDGMSPELRAALGSDVERARRERAAAAAQAASSNPAARADGIRRLERISAVNLDAFANELTGIGTVAGDKTLGGYQAGPQMIVDIIPSLQAEALARGSDLGGRMVEAIPDEMTREGWDVVVQPTPADEEEIDDAVGKLDSCRREPRRAASAWRQLGERTGNPRAYEYARRWDAIGAGEQIETPPVPPGHMPKTTGDGTDISAAITDQAVKLDILGAINQALKYERCFGGGAVLIGADDGEEDLTKPLREDQIRSIKHVTPYFGGYDGEMVAWRYYNDPRQPNYGKPEVYQLRNLGVPIARPPAPGETHPQPYAVPQGPTGPLIFYIHESRFIVFDGEPVSRRVAVQMRGWGDSVFTRAGRILSQYDQSWSAIAILLQEFSIATLTVPDLTLALLSPDPKNQQAILKRAQMLAMTQSIAHTRLVDASEKFERVTASIAGAPEALREFAMRLAAAANMPVSLLFGQVKGGLGDAGNTDLRFFYDRIAATFRQRVLPQLSRLYRLLWLAKDSPTGGVEPQKWSVVPRALWQLTDVEKADLRLKTAEADKIAIETGQVTPEEVAATRYGSAEFNAGSIVLDLEARGIVRDIEREAQIARSKKPDRPEVIASGKGGIPPENATPLGIFSPAQATTIPKMTAVPTDPTTADPSAVPSTVGQTARPRVKSEPELIGPMGYMERKRAGNIGGEAGPEQDDDADGNLIPPREAQAEAERGLAWRRQFGRGGTNVGVARARDVMNAKSLSTDTLTRMVSYFARHEVDKKGKGWSEGEEGYPSAGRIAWALWGGDAGRAWAEAQLEKLRK